MPGWKDINNNTNINILNNKGMTFLHMAAKAQDERAIRSLIADGALNIPGEYNITPLMLMADNEEYSVETMEAMCALAGDDINAQDSNGETALHHAVSCDNLSMTKILLQHGADASITDAHGNSPLITAICMGANTVAEEILLRQPHAINIQDLNGRTALHFAIARGNIPLVKMLLKHGADITIIDNDNRSPSDFAMYSADVDVLEVLLQTQPSILNLKNKEGHTMLFASIKDWCSQKVVMMLIKYGSLNTACTENNITPLMLAAYNGYEDAVRMMIRQQLIANINTQNKYGHTALDYAIRGNQVDIANILIENGAGYHLQQGQTTSLMYAIQHEYEDMVSTLMMKRLLGDVNIQDEKNNTALFYAIDKQNTYCAKALIKKGGLNIPGFNRTTPFMLAAQRGNEEIINMMIKNNLADGINTQDNGGHTALLYAVLNNHPNIVKALIDTVPEGTKIFGWEGCFLHAAQRGHTEIVKIILDRGVSSEEINFTDKLLQTALGYDIIYNTTTNGFANNAESLIKNGALNVKNKHGLTPLLGAVGKGYHNVVELMLDNKNIINLNAQNAHGQTALHHIILNNKKNSYICAEKFIKVGGLNTPDDKGVTPFMLAAQKGRSNIVELFFKYNLINKDNIDAHDSYGYTALHYAIMNGHDHIVQQLIDAGASDICTDIGTPFLIAASKGNTTIIDILLKSGIVKDINAKNKHGESVLDKALLTQCTGIVKKILLAGAHIEPIALNGENTPTKMLFKTLYDYQNGQIANDNSFEYQLAMQNKLYSLCYFENLSNADKEKNMVLAKDLVMHHPYLQTLLAKKHMTCEKVIEMFDGNIEQFFIKCKDNLDYDTYCKYIQDIINDAVIPVHVKKIAMITAIEWEMLYTNSVNTDQVKESFDLLKTCYEYQTKSADDDNLVNGELIGMLPRTLSPNGDSDESDPSPQSPGILGEVVDFY